MIVLCVPQCVHCFRVGLILCAVGLQRRLRSFLRGNMHAHQMFLVMSDIQVGNGCLQVEPFLSFTSRGFILAKAISNSLMKTVFTLAPELADVSKYRQPWSAAHLAPSSSLTTRRLSILDAHDLVRFRGKSGKGGSCQLC